MGGKRGGGAGGEREISIFFCMIYISLYPYTLPLTVLLGDQCLCIKILEF